jgi:hypothetical protein
MSSSEFRVRTDAGYRRAATGVAALFLLVGLALGALGLFGSPPVALRVVLVVGAVAGLVAGGLFLLGLHRSRPGGPRSDEDRLRKGQAVADGWSRARPWAWSISATVIAACAVIVVLAQLLR